MGSMDNTHKFGIELPGKFGQSCWHRVLPLTNPHQKQPLFSAFTSINRFCNFRPIRMTNCTRNEIHSNNQKGLLYQFHALSARQRDESFFILRPVSQPFRQIEQLNMAPPFLPGKPFETQRTRCTLRKNRAFFNVCSLLCT